MRQIRSALSRRGWFYILCLFVPMGVYNLILKTARITAHYQSVDLGGFLGLLQSDLLFNLGFSLLWMAVAVLTIRTTPRWIFLGAMHLSCLAYLIVTTSAHRYFTATGTSLDFSLVAFAFTHFDDVQRVMASESPWLSYALVLAYASFGPFLLSRTAARRGHFSLPRHDQRSSRTEAIALGVVGVALCGAALLPPKNAVNKPFALDPLLQLVVSAEATESIIAERDVAPTHTLSSAKLEKRDDDPPLNVVVVILESTGAAVTTPYGSRFETTPYLAELADRGTLVERAYTTIPHTSKALISIVCGIEPRPTRALTESLPGLVPAICLPELLEEHGYRTAFFQSATENFEQRRRLIENFGYEDFYARESMDDEGFEPANYFGLEDAAMLEPSRQWLERHAGSPFFVTYLTNTPHHDYQAPRRYGFRVFVEDDAHNRYLNSVRYLDFFVRDLFVQFQELGLMEDTVFIIVGDHGEAFGEHGRWTHDDVLYEEVVRVPLLVLAPGSASTPKRIPGPASLVDIPPTVVDLLGFELVRAQYPGASITNLPAGRSLRLHCYNDGRCLGGVIGTRKLIHYYDHQPDELFDLKRDPLERENLAENESGLAQPLRTASIEAWRNVDLMYRQHHRRKIEPFLSEVAPASAHAMDAVFGERLALVGFDLSQEYVKRGESFVISYHFEVKSRLPREWRMIVEGEGSSEETTDTRHRPLNGLYRLRFWQPGRYVTDVHEITVPFTWTSDIFKVYMSFLGTDGARVSLATKKERLGDRILVTSVSVEN